MRLRAACRDAANGNSRGTASGSVRPSVAGGRVLHCTSAANMRSHLEPATAGAVKVKSPEPRPMGSLSRPPTSSSQGVQCHLEFFIG